MRSGLPQRLQLADEIGYHAEPAVPKLRIARIEPEWRQQFRMVLGAAGCQHREVALGEAARRLLVNSIERIHQAVAECIGINVKRRVHEVRYIGPERFIPWHEPD